MGIWPTVGTGQEIILHGQVLEFAPSFHYLDDSSAYNLRSILAVDALPQEFDDPLGDFTPLGPQKIGDGLEGRAFAGPIGPKEGHKTSLRHLQGDPFQDQDDMLVDNLNIVDSEQRILAHNAG